MDFHFAVERLIVSSHVNGETSENQNRAEPLKAFVATGNEASLQPVTRNIYDAPPDIRAQVWRLERAAEEKEAIEELADQPLREDLQTALQDQHDKAVSVAKAQAEYVGALADAAYEQAAQAAEPRELFVRRGGEMGHVARCRLKPGEPLFVRTPAGEYEVIGHTNHDAEIPNELIIHDI